MDSSQCNILYNKYIKLSNENKLLKNQIKQMQILNEQKKIKEIPINQHSSNLRFCNDECSVQCINPSYNVCDEIYKKYILTKISLCNNTMAL